MVRGRKHNHYYQTVNEKMMLNKNSRWLYTFSAAFIIASGLTPSAQAKNETLFPAGDPPDLVLMCQTYDKISVQSVSVQSGKIDSVADRTASFSQAEIKRLSEHQGHKHRIVIWLEKLIDWESPSNANSLSAFESFAMSLGYKRTIILGCRAFNEPTIFDSAKGGHQKREPEPEPVVLGN